MDDLRRIDLNLLLTLQALLAEKHVTRAALRLYKSQPAVSHALAQLRDIFQDPLLIRQGGGMALTPRARELQQPLEAALGQLNALLHKGEFDASRAVRRFRVALSDYAAHLLLPPLLRQLRAQAPGIDMAISQASREAMLAQLADGKSTWRSASFRTRPATSSARRCSRNTSSALPTGDRCPRGDLPLPQWLERPTYWSRCGPTPKTRSTPR